MENCLNYKMFNQKPIMNIFLTGATGFIGSHLLQTLTNSHHMVYCLVRNNKQAKTITSLGGIPIIGNLKNLKEKNLPKKIDLVYHLAAIRSRWGTSWKEYYQTNVLGTNRLLDYAKRTKIGKFIFCSTVGVNWRSSERPISESSDAIIPKNELYHRSKKEAEKIIEAYGKDVNITIVRPGLVYGPGDDGFFAKLLDLANHKRIILVNGGENLIQLIYVKDLVDGFLLFTNKKNWEISRQKTYIFNGERPIKFKKLVQLIEKESRLKDTSYSVPKIPLLLVALIFENLCHFFPLLLLGKNEPIITPSKVDLISYNCFYTIARAKKDLGFRPKIPYKKGVKLTIK